MNSKGRKETILELAERQGLVRPKDLDCAGIPIVYLRPMVDDTGGSPR
jgi:hypothetical protein